MDNTLYFERSNGERVIIGEPKTKKELNNMIREYTYSINPNFKIYYIQITLGKDEICFDIGSHTEFFYISSTTYKELTDITNQN